MSSTVAQGCDRGDARVRRLAAVDWLLLGISLPLCLFGVVMSVVHGVRGDFVRNPLGLVSAADEQSYPILRQPPSSSGLVAGDRLLRLEGGDLRGASGAGWVLRWSQAAQAGTRSLRFTIERAGVHSDVRVPLVPGWFFPGAPWWAPLPFILSLVGTALLLLTRAAHWRIARCFYVASLLGAFFFTPYFRTPTAPRVHIVMNVLVLPLLEGLTLWNLFEFVPGVHLWGYRQQVVTWTLSLLLSASEAATYWLRGTTDWLLGMYVANGLSRASSLVTMGFAIAWLVALTQGYVRADPLGRRQIKWVVYGFYVGTLPFVAVNFLQLGLLPEQLAALWTLATIAAVAIPLGFLVAIIFYQFLDIDRLFSATLSYSVLAIVGIAIVLGVMPTASRVASDALGIAPTSGQLLLALGLAAIFVPAQRVVRPRIDRLLFPERVALEQGFEQLLAEISSAVNTQELTRLVGERLDALLRPASAVTYARLGEGFAPLAVRGRPAPPAFSAQGGLIATLQERTTPLAAERWTARRTASLTPFERAALETLDVAVLLPTRRGTDLIAFTCLGPKRSGDIYTPTDLALLGAVAGKISDRLLALDTTAVAEQARTMQEAMRRYVPGAVAQRIVSGKDVEAGEREVTVLFVDIRGYTGFSEPREAEEIFRTVNRYTETVSKLVQAHGGVVVEFHGDGLLAVFGAPEEIPMKERAAVQTARDILAAIAALPGPGGEAGLALSVGVGIATGPAFVGNIQSADRSIWTVIGNTVNLAARLQSLTRELAAAVAIDDTTFRRAGRRCADFVRHSDLAIRGRTQPETVHALPL